MKDFPLQQNSPAQNHELVGLHLDIGQCRFIHRLLKFELQRIYQNGSLDKNDAVLQLTEQMHGYAYPQVSQALHRDESLEEYIYGSSQDELNDFLSSIYVQGSFEHE